MRVAVTLISKLSRVRLLLIKELSIGNCNSITGAGYSQRPFRQYLQTLSEIKLSRGVIFQNYCYFSSTSLGSEEEQKITVIFVDKVGKEHHVKVLIGMSMLAAARHNDIDLEGACGGSLVCSTCHVVVMDEEYYNKLEEPTDDENLKLDFAFGLKKTSRLACQIIAKLELDGIRLAIPLAT